MSDAPVLPDIHNEPEHDLRQWALLNAVMVPVGLVSAAALGLTGYYLTTNGYEVTGAIILVSSIMLACHIAEGARTLLLKRQNKG